MSKEAYSIQTSADSQPSTDTVDMIMSAHFDTFTEPNIGTLVRRWKMAEENGLKEAILFLYRATNYSRENFTKLLVEEFGGTYNDLETDGLKESYYFLDAISNHCNGILIAKQDPIIRHCSRITSMTEVEIEAHAKLYFSNRIKNYLQVQYPYIRYEDDNLHIVANDDKPSASLVLVESKHSISSTKQGDITMW